MERDETLRLGIIGGCMAAQAGIPKSSLYHTVLASALERETGLRIRVAFAKDVRLPYSERLTALWGRKPPDLVYVHLRPSVCVYKAKLVCRIGFRGKDTSRQILNPLLPLARKCLESRDNLFFQAENLSLADIGDNGIEGFGTAPVRGFLPFMNSFLGVLASGIASAVRDEVELVRDLHSECRKKGIPLVVGGPTPYNPSRVEGYVLHRMDTAFERAFEGMGLAYVRLACIDGENNALQPDRHHLTVEGHKAVGLAIFEKVRGIFMEHPENPEPNKHQWRH